ncbi:hypothetical protein RJT34_17935 [Clitoria ternatea]|uniref:Uncharacterized protein n=1 Tax=Clitoria ternatea TaxID=43366 RepID=A0AAN9J9V8_CLITE
MHLNVACELNESCNFIDLMYQASRTGPLRISKLILEEGDKDDLNDSKLSEREVLGRRVLLKALENKLRRDWVVKGSTKILDMSNGFFMMDFVNQGETYGGWIG